MFRRRNFLTMAEVKAEIDSWTSDEEENECNHNADKINVVITPPDKVDDVTDNEDIDDDLQILHCNNQLPNETPGLLEMEYIYNDDNNNIPVYCELEEINSDSLQAINEIQRSKPKKKGKLYAGNKPKWSKSKQFQCKDQPVNYEEYHQKAVYEKIGKFYKISFYLQISQFCFVGSYTPLQLWECFFDEEVINMIVERTNEYAGQKYVPGFATSSGEIKTFLGILYLTGYHTLPSIRSYWSTQASLGCQIIKDAMSRNRFAQIKQNIHISDNKNLDPNDKFAKISPLNNMLNKKFMQFGIFAHHLSVDEQMIAYYGRHSLKMFIRGKPIRFGFKYWVLSSADGYCFSFIPYTGASANNNPDCGLGENVVLRLLENVSEPKEHTVTFDNFFTSHKLLCTLTQKGYFATGTVRDNRTNHALLKDVKMMKKEPRGSSEFCVDKKNKLIAVRWNDNSVSFLQLNFIFKFLIIYFVGCHCNVKFFGS